MYNVTLQRQYPDGDLVVEVGIGDYNYANPGQIGECYEFEDPREAVKLALTIAQTEEAARREIVEVAHGYTMGMTMPFSPCTPKELVAWGEEQYELRPKCGRCGEIYEGKGYYHPDLAEDDRFCSENCADNAYWDRVRYCEAHEENVFDDPNMDEDEDDVESWACSVCRQEMDEGVRCAYCWELGHSEDECPDEEW